MGKDNSRYSESLKRYAEQWTDEQILQAIADEKRILNDQSLSDVARDNSELICSIYQDVLDGRAPSTAA